jgi:hypothetical protein
MSPTDNEIQTGCFLRKYVRVDGYLGQPKFLFGFKIRKKLQEKNKRGTTVLWASQNSCFVSKFERNPRKKNT